MKNMTQAPQAEAIRRFADEAGLAQAGDTCDADTLAIRAEFWRLVEERRSGETSSDVTAADLAHERDLRSSNLMQQISCSPTNGTAWAELAEYEAASRGWSDKVANYLKLSERYAPFEGVALGTRLEVIARMAPRDDHDTLELLRRQLAASLQYAAPREIAAQLELLPTSEVAWVEDYVLGLPDARRAAIDAARKQLEASKSN